MEEETFNLDDMTDLDMLKDCVSDYADAKEELDKAQKRFEHAQEELVFAAIALAAR